MKKRERAEAVKWGREIQKEQTRRTKVTAAETKKRERAEYLKWNKEIQTEEARREMLRDLSEEKGWRGSKKIGQIRRRFRRKFERVLRKLPTFNVVKTYSNANAKFTTYFDTYKIYVYGRTDPVVVFKKAMDMTVEARGLRPGDKIRVIVSQPSWLNPFSTKLITITDDEQLLYTLLKAVLEYVEYKVVPLDEVKVEIQSTKIPREKGRLAIMKNNTGRKRCMITVKNTDTMCLSRAIVTAHANLNKDMWIKTQLKNGFNKSRPLQETEALKLHEVAGVSISDHGCTLEDVDTFAKYLGVQINTVDEDYFNEIIHTANPDVNKVIYLHKNGNHYDVITSMPAFLAKDYYCHTCKKGYTRHDKHKCPNKCLACFKPEKHTGDKLFCDKCNRTFFGQRCYEEHLKNRSKGKKRDVVCEIVKKCLECKRTVSDLKQHVCGHATCNNCKECCDLTKHQCYMLPVETKGGACTRPIPCKKDKCLCCKTRTKKYIFYDFETQQGTGTHVVNYVNAQDFNGTEHSFGTIDEFCKFVFTDEHNGYTFIAHNAKSFDAQFILKYCVDNVIKPFCIYNGTKIMYMHADKKRFIDSINFVNAPLSTFPKTFGLKELKKGYFPTLV